MNIDALRLIWACLNPNPSARPTIVQILANPWIAQAPNQITQPIAMEVLSILNAEPDQTTD